MRREAGSNPGLSIFKGLARNISVSPPFIITFRPTFRRNANCHKPSRLPMAQRSTRPKDVRPKVCRLRIPENTLLALISIPVPFIQSPTQGLRTNCQFNLVTNAIIHTFTISFGQL